MTIRPRLRASFQSLVCQRFKIFAGHLRCVRDDDKGEHGAPSTPQSCLLLAGKTLSSCMMLGTQCRCVWERCDPKIPISVSTRELFLAVRTAANSIYHCACDVCVSVRYVPQYTCGQQKAFRSQRSPSIVGSRDGF